MDYEGICPECGGYLISPYLYGCNGYYVSPPYLVCEACGLVKDLCTDEYMDLDAG